MYNLVYFLAVVFFLAFVAMIFYFVSMLFSKKDTEKFAKNRNRTFLAIGTMVASFVLIISIQALSSGNNTSSNNADIASSKKAESSKKATSSSNNEVSSSKSVKNSSSASSNNVASSSDGSSENSSSSAQTKNVEQANAAISERLTQAQGWANGTLDPNGNPTNNGTPNSAYNWAKIVTSIKYAENELTIYVNKDYVGMSKEQFANYMYMAENSALNALSEANIINESAVKNGLYTRVFDGGTKIAQSKITDRHQFKINQ